MGNCVSCNPGTADKHDSLVDSKAQAHEEAASKQSSTSAGNCVDANVQLQAATAVHKPASSTDKAASTSAAVPDVPFAQWAKQQAVSEGRSLPEFISGNTTIGSNSSSSSDCSVEHISSSRSSRPSMDEPRGPSLDWAALGLGPTAAPASTAVAPYQPFDCFLHGAPLPACQTERVLTASAIHTMRNTKHGELESILGVLCSAFGVETANMALLTGECIHIIKGCGVIGIQPHICPDRWGFCGWSFINTNHSLLVVENLKEDNRFAENFFITDPFFNLQFYVAAPLISSDEHRLGTLCLYGQEPRKFDATRGQLLANMAEMLVRQLEREWAEQMHKKKEGGRLKRSMAAYDAAYMMVDVSKPDWRVIYINNAAQTQMGVTWDFSEDLLPKITADGGPNRGLMLEGTALESYFDLQNTNTTWAPNACEFTVKDAQGAAGTAMAGRSFKLVFRLATCDGLDADQPFDVAIPAWLETSDDDFGGSLFFVQVSEMVSSSAGASSVASGKTVLSSWSAALSNGSSSRSFVPRGVEPEDCPVDGLVLGPLLGKGSYGRVYRGVYGGKPVAVKMIFDVANLRTTEDGRPLEAVLTQGLEHLGIMRTITYAYSADKKSCWMLFEHCDRTCVQDAVVRGWFRTDPRPNFGGINLRAVAVTAYEVASAMAFLHKNNIVHGDLKGGNVLLASSRVNTHGFTAKVGDFGLARQAKGPGLPKNVYGTVTHMPPEVLLSGDMGPATDVYSFGVMLWEMLTGAVAWQGLRHTQIICQVALLRRQLATPAGLPAAIEKLLHSCLAYEKDERCSFEEVLVVLSDFLQTSRDDDLGAVKLTLVADKDGGTPM